jgi:hypothetical protein
MHDELINILTNFLGPSRKHNHSKGQIAFDCPACSAEKGLSDGDGKGNLEINYYKGVYKCWSCYETNHMSGGIYHLIKNHGSKEDIGDFTLIAKELNFDIEFKTTSDEIVSELPKEFQSLLIKSNHPEYKKAISYLKTRNIGVDIIEKFNLGYCSSGKYVGRIIIPSYDANGRVNYFAGRAYKNGIKPKYLNPDTDKTTIIFNEYKLNWDATIYLVEGPFDHVVVPNSVPLLGKFLDFNYLLMDEIINKSSGLIVIVLDGDALKNIKRLYFKLNNIFKLHNRVRAVLTIPEEYDIAKIHELLGNNGVLLTLKNAERIPDCEEIY